jgi:hypothetical protein
MVFLFQKEVLHLLGGFMKNKFDVLAVIAGFRPATHNDVNHYQDGDDMWADVYDEVDVRVTIATPGGRIPTRREVYRAVRAKGKGHHTIDRLKERRVSHVYVYTYPVGGIVQFYTFPKK